MVGGAAAVRVAAPASAPPSVASAGGPGTLTLTSAQAQQMGLISPRKVRWRQDMVDEWGGGGADTNAYWKGRKSVPLVLLAYRYMRATVFFLFSD